MKYITVLFLASILILPLASAQGSLVLQIEGGGGCRYFNVTISDMNEACYDVKVDVTTANGRVGEIYDPREGWKSSYYYMKEYCISEGEDIFVQTRTTSNDMLLNFKATLKSGSSEWQSDYYEIGQDCTRGGFEEMPIEYFLIPVLLAILVIFAVIVLYVKYYKK